MSKKISGALKDVSGDLKFPIIRNLVTRVLVLPLSNAEVERCFSSLNLIKSSIRANLADNSLSALMQTKQNSKKRSYEDVFQDPEDLKEFKLILNEIKLNE
jgi:hAT family C-terminal dimerisation region